MIDQRSKLITELENLQKSRRDAVAAYKRTGDRNHWREACEVSQTITAKLHELEQTGLEPQSTDGDKTIMARSAT